MPDPTEPHGERWGASEVYSSKIYASTESNVIMKYDRKFKKMLLNMLLGKFSDRERMQIKFGH